MTEGRIGWFLDNSLRIYKSKKELSEQLKVKYPSESSAFKHKTYKISTRITIMQLLPIYYSLPQRSTEISKKVLSVHGVFHADTCWKLPNTCWTQIQMFLITILIFKTGILWSLRWNIALNTRDTMYFWRIQEPTNNKTMWLQ